MTTNLLDNTMIMTFIGLELESESWKAEFHFWNIYLTVGIM